VLRAATASAALLTALLASRTGLPSRSPTEIPTASFNDNRSPAGSRSGNVVRVSLEARRVDWRPYGPEREGEVVMAFTETGKPVAIPGPLLRVSVGTEIRATVTNHLDVKLAVHGLGSRRAIAPAPLLLEPGQTAEARFQADAEGTYFYWGARAGSSFEDRLFDDAQLNGALIVDPPGGRTDDRVFLISQHLWPDSAGQPDGRELLTVNGRPWPLTERLTYTVGDSVHWRWINASANSHPLHLHGFYYRVEARGDVARDTVYWPSQQRMAVTELLDQEQTMRMVWSPERPGGWIFHCHLTFHILGNPPLGTDTVARRKYFEYVFDPHTVHEPAHHVERAMGGLMLGMYVKPNAPIPVGSTPRRILRLFVQTGKLPGDTARHYSYLLQEGAEPARDSVAPWAPTIVLRRGEPTSIRVINRSTQATAVHWHGLEIESPFDGVVGVGGYSGSPVPPIMPGDSFEVRVTPPRSGSFMYHTHMAEIFQQSGGLWGPLLVLDPDKPWDREHDLVFQAGSNSVGEPWLNGRERHDTLTLMSGVSYRFRLMNVTLANPALQFWLVRAGAPVRWTQLARDGFDLPAWQREGASARLHVGIGETKDVEVRFTRPGPHALEVRGGGGGLFASQPIKVMARDSVKP
jgi:FtsP/CotA-like multicopper oxidase with cupredoxin domain